jgi:hypothetical protein
LTLLNFAGGNGVVAAAPVSEPSRYRSSFRATDYLAVVLALLGV